MADRSVVQTNFANGNPVTSVSFTLTSAPTVGNTLFISASVPNNSATLSVPATWTLVDSHTDGGGNQQIRVWKYVVQSGASTTQDHLGNNYTVTTSSSSALDAFIAEVFEGDPGASLSVVKANTGGTATNSLASGDIVVGTSGSVILGWFGSSGLCSGSTYTSGWTSSQANARNAMVRRTTEPVTAGTYSVTRNWTTTARHNSFIALVIPPYVSGTNHTSSATDAEGLTDAATPATTGVRSQDEAEGLLDAATGVHSAVRSATDPAGLSDVMSATLVLAVALGDTLGLDDSGDYAGNTGNDVVGVTDGITAQHDVGGESFSQTNPETLGLVDVATGAVTYVRTLTDTIGLTDSFAVTGDLTLILSESLGVTDPRTVAVGYNPTATDPAGLADSGSYSFERTADLGQISDSVSAVILTVIPVTITDGLGLTDNGSYEGTKASEPMGLSDVLDVDFAVGGNLTHTRSASDSLSILDTSEDMAFDVAQIETEEIGGLDAASHLFESLLTPTEPVGLTDPVVSALTKPLAYDEAAGLTDTASAVLGINVELTEPIGLLDPYERGGSRVRDAGTDPAGLLDNLGVSIIRGSADLYVREPTDPAGITDSVSTAMPTKARTVDDLAGLTDEPTVTHNRALTVSITDAIGALDGVTRVAGFAPTVTSTVGGADATVDDEEQYLTLLSAAGLTDTASSGLTRPVSLLDSLGGLDSLSAAGAFVRATLNDPDRVELLDGITIEIKTTHFVDLTDVVSFSDLALDGVTFSRTYQERFGLGDWRAFDGSAAPKGPMVLDVRVVEDTQVHTTVLAASEEQTQAEEATDLGTEVS